MKLTSVETVGKVCKRTGCNNPIPRDRTYCSRECFAIEQTIKVNPEDTYEQVVGVCGHVFTRHRTHKNKKYCSKSCAIAYRRRAKAGNYEAARHECEAPDCKNLTTNKRYCSDKCYRTFHRGARHHNHDQPHVRKVVDSLFSRARPSTAIVDDGSGCQHHWRIDTPDGPSSSGVCRKCGRERSFKNSDRHDGRYGAVDRPLTPKQEVHTTWKK